MTIQQHEFETYRTLILSEQIEQRHVPQLLKENPEFAEWYRERMTVAQASGSGLRPAS